MSLLRSPTNATSGGSQPDLSKLTSMEKDSITFRKRKQTFDHECSCSKDIQEMRTQVNHMTSLLEKYVGANELSMNKVQSSISEINTQIAEIKTSNEQTIKVLRENVTELITQINEIKLTSSNIASEQTSCNTKLKILENKISLNEEKINSLESSMVTTSTKTFQTMNSYSKIILDESLIREISDRQEREKNVIITGVPEQTCQSADERIRKDELDIMEITRSICNDIPKPTKIVRLGKYNPSKNRRLKVCYNTKETAKQLLRNKTNLPDNIKIFSDQTVAQQKYLKSLKEELSRLTNEGQKDLTIKYINGIPTIIKLTPKN